MGIEHESMIALYQIRSDGRDAEKMPPMVAWCLPGLFCGLIPTILRPEADKCLARRGHSPRLRARLR